MEEEEEDLAALLERELEELSDREDEEFDLNEQSLQLASKEPEDSMDEEWRRMLESADNLTHLQQSVVTPRVLEVHDEDGNQDHDEPPNLDWKLKEEPCKVSGESDSKPDLTAEEILIIEELLVLMVESVERCAPITSGNRNLEPLHKDAIDLASAALVLINDDSDVRIDASLLHLEDEKTLNNDISNLLGDRMAAEVKLTKEANIHSAQENDRIMWVESNRFKQELEEERKRADERKKRREEAKHLARLDRTATNIQRIALGWLIRKQIQQALVSHREEQARQKRELIQLHLRQEEEARIEALRLERERELRELSWMIEEEVNCRNRFTFIDAEMERTRCEELALFAAEDDIAMRIRSVVLESRLKMDRFLELAAEEDVEYDFAGYGSDSSDNGSDNKSEFNERSECDDSPAAVNQPYKEQPNQPPFTVESGTAVSVHLQNASHTSATALSQHMEPSPPTERKPPNKMALKPVSRPTKPVVSVDPKQGKRWGGSINTAAWSAPNTDSITLPAQGQAERQAEQLLSNVMTADETAIIRLEPYTSMQLIELEKQRLLSMELNFSGPDRRLNLSSLSKTSESSQLPSSVDFSSPPVVLALRHWSKWWKRRKPVQLPQHLPKEFKISNGDVSTEAERNNDVALTNSMVDLETDPLLARELDFCVEGLSSTTFLRKFLNLTKLSINVNKLTELSGVAGLSELVSLSAKDNKISNVEPLGGLRKLRYLYLDSNRINNLNSLSGLPELIVLSVNSNLIRDMPSLSCPNLQRIELSRNKIGVVLEKCLSGVPALNHLNLSSNQITGVSGEALSSCPLLQTLILSENQLTALPVPLRLPLLKNLRINLNRITDLDGWSHSESNPWPFCAPSLQKLILSDNQISSIPAGILDGCLLLEELDLSFNSLAERECMTEIRACKMLTTLHIQDNVFTTVPVTGQNAGTSRTALGEPQMQLLYKWLLSLCPSLETISGNKLDKSLYSDYLAQLLPRKVMEEFIRNNAWVSPSSLRDNFMQCKYQNSQESVRQILTLIQAHQQSQSILTVMERAVKKDEAAASKSQSKRINVNAAQIENEKLSITSRDWDKELSDLLHCHLRQLLSVDQEINGLPGDAQVVFINFSKGKILSSDSTSPIAPQEIRTTFALPAFDPIPRTEQKARELPLNCILTIQRCFRGRSVRKRVAGAFKSIRYQDDELDELLGGNEFNLDDMMDLTYMEDEPPRTMVYGDHIRKRSRPGSSSKPNSSGTANPAQTVATIPLNLTDQSNHHHWVLPVDDPHSPTALSQSKEPFRGAHAGERPSTAMSTVSSISAQTDTPDQAAMAYGSGASTPAASTRSENQQNVSDTVSVKSSARRPQRASAASIAQEWGISDPKVLASIMKRNQRMHSFEDEKMRKELDKDPIHRLEKFQKNASRGFGANAMVGRVAGTSGNTRTSGSFGGAPKTIRGGAGATKRRSMAPPAWMLGEDAGDSAT